MTKPVKTDPREDTKGKRHLTRGDGERLSDRQELPQRATGDKSAMKVQQRAKPVPFEQFGRDHWSTFAYVETRVVDARGVLDVRRMRCDPSRHPTKNHLPLVIAMQKYPTRLRDGTELFDHDDWDCLEDMEAAGLIRNVGTGEHVVVEFTDYGWLVASSLRKHRGTRKTTGAAYVDFVPPVSRSESSQAVSAVSGAPQSSSD